MNSDDRLVELVIGGDDMAFELLYARHVADALAFADGLLGSREEAEQAVRHSFAAAHAYLADGGRKTAFEPWLYTILDNYCLSVLRRRRGGEEPPEGDADAATVVDIEQWRRKRKLLGAGVPVVPSAGFHDSVMTACGIGGAGAASAAAPLLGGTVAKVAVVVLLAGGAGVAGNAVSDEDRPADVGQAPAPLGVSDVASSGAGLVTQLSRPDRRSGSPPLLAWSPRPGDGGAERPAPSAGERPAPSATQPIGRPGDGGVAASPIDVRIPAESPTGAGTPAAATPPPPRPDPSDALRRLGERVKEGLPTLVERLKARLPAAGEPPAAETPKLPIGVELPEVDLPKGVVLPEVRLPSDREPRDVGDDGYMPAAQSSVDGRVLLEQSAGVPPA